jgi:type IV pilus assembly protein PilA
VNDVTEGSGLKNPAPIPAAIAADQQQPGPIGPREAFDANLWGGFQRRFIAQAVDGVILETLFAILALIGLPMAARAGATSTSTVTAILGAYLVLFVFYHGLGNSSPRMATRGRRAAGVVVASADSGGRIGMARASWRALVSLVTGILIIPNLLVIFTRRRRSVADLLSGTVVLQTEPIAASGAAIALATVIFFFETVGGLLAVILLPVMMDFEVRTKVTEAFVLANTAQMAVTENFMTDGDPSAGALARDYVFTPTRYVENITIGDGGKITIVFNATTGIPQLAGQNVLTLQANIDGRPLAAGSNGLIEWACAARSSTRAKSQGLSIASGATLPQRYAPQNCR